MDANVPPPPPPTQELAIALQQGRACDYCPNDNKRRASRALFTSEVVGPGKTLSEVRFLCTACEIRALDRALGRESLVLTTPEGDLTQLFVELRDRVKALEDETDRRRAKKPRKGAP